MTIRSQVSLKSLNTMGVETHARYFTQASTQHDITEALAFADEQHVPLLVLGGGSNIIFVDDPQALVLQVANKGIEILEETADSVTLKVAAGEVWHPFVRWCLQQGYYGLENLSLIPGSVGAAPIQNIGAYGVELTSVFHSLEAVEIDTGKILEFSRDDCQFGYRDSIFKGPYKGRCVITQVVFQLSKIPTLKLAYKGINEELEVMGVKQITPQAVSDAVCRIRSSKLPDPAEIGNAGSFFKNPVIDSALVEQLKIKNPDLVAFPAREGCNKVAAGWLIEQCGWKGHRESGVGVHAKQALVLVNYGEGNGRDILTLAEKVKGSVREEFGIELEVEPNVYVV